MQNIKLTLGYDGSAYHGFQVQANAHTVQEALETAIAEVFGVSLRITAAGRTDTGVHAIGQVVNFKVATRIPIERIPYALNSCLPDDIVVYQAQVVPDEFHARYDAKSKIYTYTIDNSPHPHVLKRKYAYYVRFPLNLALMQQAASGLIGLHDFASFCASGSPVKSTIRNLMRVDVTEEDQLFTITAEANGFLYNMVRIITGTLIEVGRERRSPDLTRVLSAKSRHIAGQTAPPHGLILQEVKY